LPAEAVDGLRAAVQKDRYQFWEDFSALFYGSNRPGAKVSEGVTDSFFRQCSMAGFPASYFGIKAFSETDFNEDLRKFDVPTLVMHGDDDQIVPIAATALLSAKIIPNATLKVYPGYPHGMCQTEKDVINEDLLAFIQQPQPMHSTAS
jgi:non-heme chloroperoxidase